MKIGIVVPCYNRVSSLQRLLTSLVEGNYGNSQVDLVFSIDRSGSDGVELVAKAFVWLFGDKRLFVHSQNIGLKQNILFCGDLVDEYDAVIILEDDLYVARDFYQFAKQAAYYYQENQTIAGISLYSYCYAEIGNFQFYPFQDGKDNFFIQWPSSWGQLWTKSQWKAFRDWLLLDKDIATINIPSKVKQWPHSWKKFFIAYMVDTNKYFVYPYASFTNEFGTAGVHYRGESIGQNTVNLFMGINVQYCFRDFQPNSLFNYDCFYQWPDRLIKIGNEKYKVSFDLYANKEIQNISADYVITSRKQPKSIASFSHLHIPFEYNILKEITGDFFYLVKREDFVANDLEVEKKISLRFRLSTRDMINKVNERIKNKVMKMFVNKYYGGGVTAYRCSQVESLMLCA